MAMASLVSSLQFKHLHSSLPGFNSTLSPEKITHQVTEFINSLSTTTETPSFSYTLKEKEEKDIIVNKYDSVSKEIIATTTKKPEAEKQKKKKKKQQVVMEMGLTKEAEENDMIEVMKGKRLPKKKQRKSTKYASQNDYFLARPAGYGFRVTFTAS